MDWKNVTKFGKAFFINLESQELSVPCHLNSFTLTTMSATHQLSTNRLDVWRDAECGAPARTLTEALALVFISFSK